MEVNSTRTESEIQEFYSERNVFITGVSGFLGKSILEKLLRSCPSVGTINVLMRPKRGLDVNSRIQSLIQTPIFDRLRRDNPDALKKLRVISGDICSTELGLSDMDRRHLTDTVSIVIHSAASVKFNEPLKQAMNINYYGTQRVLNLAHQMSHLAAFLHVSTAYANCELDRIPETLVQPAQVPVKGFNELSDELADEMTSRLVGKKPNTYTYTKCLGENLIMDQGGQLPIAIVRPSIIGATWQEPEPGFVDSIGGLTGVIAACSKGFLTSLNCIGENVCDVIPLDVVSNLIIATGWDIGVNHRDSSDMNIPVYNCCTGTKNPLRYNDIMKFGTPAIQNSPMENPIRYPKLFLTKSTFLYLLINTILTFIPCLILDIGALLTKRKIQMIKIYRKVLVAMNANSYFHQRQFQFETNNMDVLWKRLSLTDQRIFYWNIEELDWDKYMWEYCKGIKRWIFKEDFANVSNAKKHLNRMYWLEKIIEGILFCLLWSFFIKPFVTEHVLSKLVCFKY